MSRPERYRFPGYHLRLCQQHRVAVAPDPTDPLGWWKAAAYDAAGQVVFASGGRTRRRAEQNVLNGLGCPLITPDVDSFGGFSALLDDGPE